MRKLHFLCLLALLATVLVLCLPAEAKTCVTRNSNAAWRHSQGMFQRVSATDKKWIEYNDKHHEEATFTEIMRDGQQVVLQDESRGVQILLRSDLCGVKQTGEQNFRQLYAGSFMRVVDCT